MTTMQKLAKWRGSNFERKIAKLVHGVVVGRSKAIKVGDKLWIKIDCQKPPDVVNEWASFECKYYRKLPVFITKVMAQAIQNSPEGLTPFAVLGDRGNRSQYVVMTLQDFLDWHIGEKE